MARTWLSIRVDLVSGLDGDYWPRPGRIFAAARSHSFRELAEAIDTSFARWDRAHLHQFVLADGRRIGQPEFDDFDQGFIDSNRTKLSTLVPGEQFLYEFDFGDSWLHLCTVGLVRIDPTAQLGIVPAAPLPYWGWGMIPDQYGRRWDGDDGEHDEPPNPGTSELPPLHPWWADSHAVRTGATVLNQLALAQRVGLVTRPPAATAAGLVSPLRTPQPVGLPQGPDESNAF